MFKFFAVFLPLTMFTALPVSAQTNQTTASSAETELDREADNLNIIPATERLKLKRSNTKNIDLNLKNSTKGEITDIIKNANQAKIRAAKQEGRPPAQIPNIDPNNKQAVRKMLQDDLFLEPHPRFYE